MSKTKKLIDLQEEAKTNQLDGLHKHLEVFNDAVIAIILTIMLLEIPIPIHNEGTYEEFLKAVFVFIVSFFIVANFWYEHHKTMSLVHTLTKWIVVINFLFLMTLSLIPLLTKWIMLDIGNNVAILNYGIVYFCINFVQLFMHRMVYVNLFGKGEMVTKQALKIVNIRMILTLSTNILLVILASLFPSIVMGLYLLLPILSFLFSE